MARRKRRRRILQPSRQKEPSKQWIYFMWNFPFFFVVKVGISRDRSTLWKRFTDIDAENIGFDFPVLFLKVYGARTIEKWNKDLGSFFRMKANFFRGTGRTERFLLPGAIPVLLMTVIAFVIEWSIKLGLIILFIYTMKNFPE